MSRGISSGRSSTRADCRDTITHPSNCRLPYSSKPLIAPPSTRRWLEQQRFSRVGVRLTYVSQIVSKADFSVASVQVSQRGARVQQSYQHGQRNYVYSIPMQQHGGVYQMFFTLRCALTRSSAAGLPFCANPFSQRATDCGQRFGECVARLVKTARIFLAG
jgi:hypothetical protein